MIIANNDEQQVKALRRFLHKYAIEIPYQHSKLEWSSIPDGHLPVVLIENNHQIAVAIIGNQEILEEITDNIDVTFRKIFIVSISTLTEVAGPDFETWRTKQDEQIQSTMIN